MHKLCLEDRNHEFEVSENQNSERLDRALSSWNQEISRSFFQKLIREGKVKVNGIPQKSNYRVVTGDKISVVIPQAEALEILPENIPRDILYEDADVLVVNKPKGMVVHPSAGHCSGTLVNAVMYHCRDSLSGINGIIRPGIVHRIDMDTTGALIICKNDHAHLKIAEQIKEHSVTRRYLGIVRGIVKEFELETGRTHQIRVHMASIGHPLLGDRVYGSCKSFGNLQGQTLHAAIIGFIHPSNGQYLEVKAPLPEYFESLLKKQL